MKILGYRTGHVIEIGNSLGLTIREELIDLGLTPGDAVIVQIIQTNAGEKAIRIKKTEKK